MMPTSPASTTRPELAAIVSNVLGELAFMITDRGAGTPPAGLVWLEGRVSYQGPVHGTLRLWCTREFATQLAANLLGTDPDDGNALQAAEDAVREFANVVCGHLVTAWYGSGPVFNLTIPTVEERATAPETTHADGAGTCRFIVDDQPLFVSHQLDAGPGPT